MKAPLFSACLLAILLAGCATIERFGHAVATDATSPAGQAILADVAMGSLNVGLDVASGNETGAVLAGLSGAASALRTYEGTQESQSPATLARIAAVGSGVPGVADFATPRIGDLIAWAQKANADQSAGLSASQIIETVAGGLDQAAATKRGEAP